MFSRAYPHGSASIAALAGGEIEANRQVCPTIVGGATCTLIDRLIAVLSCALRAKCLEVRVATRLCKRFPS